MDAMMTAKGDVWVSCHYPAHIIGNIRHDSALTHRLHHRILHNK